MRAVICPYCGEKSFTSSPEIMAKCSSCGKRFAEITTPDEQLVIIDQDMPNAESLATELTEKWQNDGASRKRAIVDRRRIKEKHKPPERRRYNNS